VNDEAADALSEALLTLGLEDLIPLWEAAGSPEVRAVAPSVDPVGAIGRTLRNLVLDGQVQVYEGQWDAEPMMVATDVAVDLVVDTHWCAYPPDDHRVYFVNVENLRAP
jgi:hypothetical protein